MCNIHPVLRTRTHLMKELHDTGWDEYTNIYLPALFLLIDVTTVAKQTSRINKVADDMLSTHWNNNNKTTITQQSKKTTHFLLLTICTWYEKHLPQTGEFLQIQGRSDRTRKQYRIPTVGVFCFVNGCQYGMFTLLCLSLKFRSLLAMFTM